MLSKLHANAFFVVLAAFAWTVSPVLGHFNLTPNDDNKKVAPCPSGHSVARLTGWMLNEKMPIGTAHYDEAAQKLEVSVDSVGLPDGSRLTVLNGDDRIGELSALAAGKATVTVTGALKQGDRVRILQGDRPIVSGNLKCDASAATPTPSPTASPTATPSPTASPSVTPTPSPTLQPGS